MKNKYLYIPVFIALFALLFISFIDDNPYFKITEKNVDIRGHAWTKTRECQECPRGVHGFFNSVDKLGLTWTKLWTSVD